MFLVLIMNKRGQGSVFISKLLAINHKLIARNKKAPHQRGSLSASP